MKAGWWRRNRWGLVGIVPAVAALLALSAENVYYGVWSQNPRQPIPADASGRFPLRDVKIRLLDLAPASGMETFRGDPFVPPPHVTIWHARVEFEGDSDGQIGGCSVHLEDERGRVYDSGPVESQGASDRGATGCLPQELGVKGVTTYVNDLYFALPSDARGIAVRITTAVDNPRYVRLTRG